MKESDGCFTSTFYDVSQLLLLVTLAGVLSKSMLWIAMVLVYEL